VPEQGAGGPDAPDRSRAFELLVEDPDDIVGLIAYAKYKESVREGALQGNVADLAARNLTPVMVNMLRSAAKQMIAQVVSDGIAAASPEIQQTAAVAAVNATKEEVKAAVEKSRSDTLRELTEERQKIETHVTKRTGYLAQFATNLLAWMVSVAIVVLIVLSRQGQNVEDEVIDAVRAPQQQQQLEQGKDK
jgi:hypothetical protein